MAMFDDLAVLLRCAERTGLKCVTLNRRDGVWRAYAERIEMADGHEIVKGFKREDKQIVVAMAQVLQPRIEVRQFSHRERLGELEDALNELIELLFEMQAA